MLSLAEQLIFERYKRPSFAGIVTIPDLEERGINQSCGDEVMWTATVNDGHFTELKHQSRACAICSASADLLAEQLQNAPVHAAEKLTNEEVISWLEITLSPTRQHCATLALETLKKGLDSLQHPAE